MLFFFSLDFQIAFWYPATLSQVSRNYNHCIKRHSGTTRQNDFMSVVQQRILWLLEKKVLKGTGQKELGSRLQACLALLENDLLQRTREGNVEKFPSLLSKLPGWPVTDKRRCARGQVGMAGIWQYLGRHLGCPNPSDKFCPGLLPERAGFSAARLLGQWTKEVGLENNLRLLGRVTFRSHSRAMF